MTLQPAKVISYDEESITIEEYRDGSRRVITNSGVYWLEPTEDVEETLNKTTRKAIHEAEIGQGTSYTSVEDLFNDMRNP